MAVFDELDEEVQKLSNQIEEMKDDMGIEEEQLNDDRDQEPEVEQDDGEQSQFMDRIEETKQLIDEGDRSKAIEKYSQLALDYRRRKAQGKLTDDEEAGMQDLHDALDTAKEE